MMKPYGRGIVFPCCSEIVPVDSERNSAKQFPVEVAETGCRSFAAVWFSPSSSSNFYSRQLEYYYGSRLCVQSNCPRAVFSIIPRCGQIVFGIFTIRQTPYRCPSMLSFCCLCWSCALLTF